MPRACEGRAIGTDSPLAPPQVCFCLFAMLVGAMMFGYMMSTIGSMVAAMDREAAIREDRIDAVKEWIASRNMPHNLFVRVRKYYEHYYMKKSALNEDDILEQPGCAVGVGMTVRN